MKPVIALVGRPNVGKSTLFNSLTRSRDALIADFPGLTRDRQYGLGKVASQDYVVVDTGGLSGERESIDELMARQTWFAIKEASGVVMLVDGREGLTAADEWIANRLRRCDKPLVLAVNKTDGVDPDQATAEFFRLGINPVMPLAAAHGRGVSALMTALFDLLPELQTAQESPSWEGIRIAFIGRPNVGKSTLINRLLGEERMLSDDRPGTTRDSIAVPFENEGQRYTLIDTAGVRRRSRVKETVEKFSVIKSLQAIEFCQVAIAVLDAKQGITDQDASLLGLILEAGRAVVIVVNKCDGLDKEAKDRVRRALDLKLPFLHFAEHHMISALHGSGVGKLLPALQRAYDSAVVKLSTAQLTQLLEQALAAHQTPLVRGRRIKLRYAHQGGQNPPVIVIHGNKTEDLSASYRRYLMNYLIKGLGLTGTPLRLEFKTGANPFAGRHNRLTPRQVRRRERIIRHAKGR